MLYNYAQARSLIKTGDLLAWSNGGWKSWHDIQVSIARIGQRSEYSHVGMACVLNGRVFILESVGKEVRLYPLSKELPFYWISSPKELGQVALDYAFSKLGEEYSKWQAIKSLFGKLNIGEDNKWECSEYFIAILNADGEKIEALATPSAVVKWCISYWGSLQYIINE
jgi:hypothetical protein